MVKVLDFGIWALDIGSYKKRYFTHMDSAKLDFVEIYTDGSCHTQLKAGAWVAILLIGGEKKILEESVLDTSHNRMELTAVIKAIEYVKTHHAEINHLKICSDSQYVIGLSAREEKLTSTDFITKRGKQLPNTDLVIKLLGYFRSFNIEFVKIKAHQKPTGISDYNIEADILSRKLVRQLVNEKFI